MNQSHGHWLLFHALTITKLQIQNFEMVEVSNGTKILNQFHFELLFQINMKEKIIKVLNLFSKLIKSNLMIHASIVC
jgi:hypothetical protein